MIRKEEVYKIGVINKPHGIHGEMSFTFTDDAFDREDSCDYIVLLLDGIFVPFFIEEYRFRSDSTALIKIKGIDTAEKARKFTNTDVYFPVEYSGIEDGSNVSLDFFKGFRIMDIEAGNLGEITDIDDSTENILFVINYNGNELLIPAREEFIVEVDQMHRSLTMNLPEGLLSL